MALYCKATTDSADNNKADKRGKGEKNIGGGRSLDGPAFIFLLYIDLSYLKKR